MVAVEQRAAERIGDRCPHLGAHEGGTGVVPDAMSPVDAVDVAVERAGRHQAEIEGTGPEHPRLGRAERPARRTVQADDGVGHRRAPRGPDRFAIAPRPRAALGAEPHPAGLVDHQRYGRTVGVDEAQGGGVPGHPASSVGRSVDGVDDHEFGRLRPLEAALLAEHADTGAPQHVEGGGISHHIEHVLPHPVTRHPAVPHVDECRRDGVGHLVEEAHSIPEHGLHGSVTRVGSAARERTVVAVIDVAGFVADLKSHAIDHGFHVHDERHFVETYSLRQLWEVDLHPEEACNGPIDLHLSLEVDPRALLGFEDEVMKMDDPDGDPPLGFTFPLLFTWTLPPLPDPPDLLVLATEVAGVGGVDLPVEVSAIDSFASVTDAPERSLSLVARISVELADVYTANEEAFCNTLVRCRDVSLYLLDNAPTWLES